MTEYKRIQLRRDTSDNWQTENPVLMEGEIGVDLTSNNIKIGDGLKTWNELEYVSNDVDLSNYYTKDETETLVKATETTLELAIEEKVDNDTYNEKIDEIEAVLEGKANKTDIPSLDDYVTKDDYNVKMNAVDNAIATKADAEETANRFNSVDGYLEDLHTEIEGKADAGSVPTKTSELTNDSGFLTEHQSLDNYYTKGETDNAIQGAKTALEGEINSKADIEDVPTYTTELTLAGRYGTTNLEVYTKEPQGIIPPNNEIWYKTTDGEYVDIINNMVFYQITNESGEEITHSVQYEDDGDLHKWIFSDDVYNVEFEWRNFELNNRITDIFIPSKVNDLFWRYQGETLKHIVFGGDTLGINMDISSDSIVELYRNERIFIDGNLYCLVKVPSEFLEEYKRYLPIARIEAIGDIESIATTDYVDNVSEVLQDEIDNRLENYLPLSGGNLTGNLTLGSTAETAYKKFEAIRIPNGAERPSGAAFYVNSDGTAAFYHKSYTVVGSAINDAILKFDTNGIQFAKSGSVSSTATQFKNVLVDGDLQTEDWQFELEDGSVITKTIYLK